MLPDLKPAQPLAPRACACVALPATPGPCIQCSVRSTPRKAQRGAHQPPPQPSTPATPQGVDQGGLQMLHSMAVGNAPPQLDWWGAQPPEPGTFLGAFATAVEVRACAHMYIGVITAS